MFSGARCAVKACDNSAAKFREWRQSKCATHDLMNGDCGCDPPFHLFSFPKSAEERLKWEKNINRTRVVRKKVVRGTSITFEDKVEPWTADPKDRVCSQHFVFDEPTPQYPDPVVNMEPENQVEIENITQDLTQTKRPAVSIFSPRFSKILSDVLYKQSSDEKQAKKRRRFSPRGGRLQTGASQANASQAGPSRANPSQASSSQAGASQANASQAGPSRAGSSQASAPKQALLNISRSKSHSKPALSPIPEPEIPDAKRAILGVSKDVVGGRRRQHSNVIANSQHHAKVIPGSQHHVCGYCSSLKRLLREHLRRVTLGQCCTQLLAHKRRKRGRVQLRKVKRKKIKPAAMPDRDILWRQQLLAMRDSLPDSYSGVFASALEPLEPPSPKRPRIRVLSASQRKAENYYQHSITPMLKDIRERVRSLLTEEFPFMKFDDPPKLTASKSGTTTKTTSVTAKAPQATNSSAASTSSARNPQVCIKSWSQVKRTPPAASTVHVQPVYNEHGQKVVLIDKPPGQKSIVVQPKSIVRQMLAEEKPKLVSIIGSKRPEATGSNAAPSGRTAMHIGATILANNKTNEHRDVISIEQDPVRPPQAVASNLPGDKLVCLVPCAVNGKQTAMLPFLLDKTKNSLHLVANAALGTTNATVQANTATSVATSSASKGGHETAAMTTAAMTSVRSSALGAVAGAVLPRFIRPKMTLSTSTSGRAAVPLAATSLLSPSMRRVKTPASLTGTRNPARIVLPAKMNLGAISRRGQDASLATDNASKTDAAADDVEVRVIKPKNAFYASLPRHVRRGTRIPDDVMRFEVYDNDYDHYIKMTEDALFACEVCGSVRCTLPEHAKQEQERAAGKQMSGIDVRRAHAGTSRSARADDETSRACDVIAAATSVNSDSNIEIVPIPAHELEEEVTSEELAAVEAAMAETTGANETASIDDIFTADAAAISSDGSGEVVSTEAAAMTATTAAEASSQSEAAAEPTPPPQSDVIDYKQTPFVCTLCRLGFHSKFLLRHHCELHYTSGPHMCVDCRLKFDSDVQLLRHRDEAHGVSQCTHITYRCCNCPMRFPMRFNLIRHMNMEHGPAAIDGLFKNKYGALSSEELMLMRRMYTTCEFCQRNLSLFRIEHHVTLFHITGKPMIKCEKCDYKAKHPTLMRKHMLRHGVIPYLCAVCAEPFSCVEELKRHEHDKHKEPMSHVCKTCNKSYETLASLRQHRKKIHQKKKEFMCHVCAFTTSQLPSLKLHIRTQHEEKHYYRHVCQMCGFATKQKCTLTSHLKKRHPHLWLAQKAAEMDTTAVTCELCGYAASTKQALSFHMAHHHSKFVQQDDDRILV